MCIHGLYIKLKLPKAHFVFAFIYFYICEYLYRILYEYKSKCTRILTQFRRKAFEDFQDGTDEAALDPRGLVLQKMKRKCHLNQKHFMRPYPSDVK